MPNDRDGASRGRTAIATLSLPLHFGGCHGNRGMRGGARLKDKTESALPFVSCQEAFVLGLGQCHSTVLSSFLLTILNAVNGKRERKKDTRTHARANTHAFFSPIQTVAERSEKGIESAISNPRLIIFILNAIRNNRDGIRIEGGKNQGSLAPFPTDTFYSRAKDCMNFSGWGGKPDAFE